MPNWRFSGGKKIPRAATATGLPEMKISPLSGSSNPATNRNVVVLPQPDGPSSVKISPRSMEKLTPSTALTAPKRLTTSRNSRTGALIVRKCKTNEAQESTLGDPKRFERLERFERIERPDLKLFVEQLAVVAPVGVGMHRFVTGAARFADHDVDVFLGNRLWRAEQTGLIVDHRRVV